MDCDGMKQGGYRVEVSGWDSEFAFFVERGCIRWDSEGNKYVQISQKLWPGAIVFVRSIRVMNSPASFPATYRVLEVGAADSSGFYIAELSLAGPQATRAA